MDENEIQLKHKHLDFTYYEYEKKCKCLENWKLDKYYIFEQIGEGQYAQIYRGMNGQTKKEVAIKLLDIRHAERQQNPAIRAIRKRLIDEQSKIMMRINSPNVLKCFETFSNKDLKIMIVQYCNQGSLGNKIEISKKIPEDESISILKQILKGISECHKQQIIHRDLKPDNILIHNGEIKIADFGFSKKLSLKHEGQATKNTILGTPITMAPEVLEKKPYGLKADIWSIGIIFFWMIFGVCPFKQNSKNDQILSDIRRKLSSNLDQFNGIKPTTKVKKFLKQVLVIDVEQRLGWKEVLNHEIFSSDDKSLPNYFYRQAQIKKDDEQLFQMEREFINLNSSVNIPPPISEKAPQFSKTSKQCKESSAQTPFYTQKITKDEINSSIWSDCLESETPNAAERSSIGSQFSYLRDSTLPIIPNEGALTPSSNEKIEEKMTIHYEDDDKPFMIHKNEIKPQLPRKEELQMSLEKKDSIDEKKYETTESRRKPIFKSLSDESDVKVRRNKSIVKGRELISPKKKQAKNASQTIVLKQSDFVVHEIQNQEASKTVVPSLPQKHKHIENQPNLRLKDYPSFQDIQKKQLGKQAKDSPLKKQEEDKLYSPVKNSPVKGQQRKTQQQPQLPKISLEDIQVQRPQMKQQISRPKQNKIKEQTEIKFVNPSQINKMKRQINREQDELFAWVRKAHVQCLKTQIIFNKIVKMIQKYNLLKINERRVIQMMYLLCNRCRNNISPIYYQYQRRQNSTVLQQISQLVKRLYKQVTQKYYHYSGLLTQKQNQKMIKLRDWFSKRIFSQRYKKNDIFLTGVENMSEFRGSNEMMSKKEVEEGEGDVLLADYTKEDQIEFTNGYVMEMMVQLGEGIHGKEVLPYMKNFKQICMIKMNDSTIYNFKQTVGYIIRDQSYRQENFK